VTLVVPSIVGLVAIALLARIIEKLAFEAQSPARRAASTVGTAWAIAWILAGYGGSDLEPFAWTTGLAYIPSAMIVMLWFSKRYAAVKPEDELPDIVDRP
jgi:hypothetical protein